MWYVFLLMSVALIALCVKFPVKDEDNELDKVNLDMHYGAELYCLLLF